MNVDDDAYATLTKRETSQFFRAWPAEETPKADICETSFFVPGIPAPGGSKKGFYNPKTRRVVIVDDAKRNKDWRASVAMAASRAFDRPETCALAVRVSFQMPRPKGHFRADGSVKPKAPRYPTTRPDATKLWRSTEDALKGIAWLDDSQVVKQYVEKVYGDRPGADITVLRLDDGAVLKPKGKGKAA